MRLDTLKQEENIKLMRLLEEKWDFIKRCRLDGWNFYIVITVPTVILKEVRRSETKKKKVKPTTGWYCTKLGTVIIN